MKQAHLHCVILTSPQTLVFPMEQCSVFTPHNSSYHKHLPNRSMQLSRQAVAHLLSIMLIIITSPVLDPPLSGGHGDVGVRLKYALSH